MDVRFSPAVSGAAFRLGNETGSNLEFDTDIDAHSIDLNLENVFVIQQGSISFEHSGDSALNNKESLPPRSLPPGSLPPGSLRPRSLPPLIFRLVLLSPKFDQFPASPNLDKSEIRWTTLKSASSKSASSKSASSN
jgi:hypothetical protein